MQNSKDESKVTSNAEETRGEEPSVAPSGGAKVEQGMEKKEGNKSEVAHPEDDDHHEKRQKRSSIKAVAHSIIELENMFEMGASSAFSFSAGSINRFADDVRHTGLRKQLYMICDDPLNIKSKPERIMAIIIQIFLTIVVLLSIATFCTETINDRPVADRLLKISQEEFYDPLEWVFTIIFSVEVVLRLLVAESWWVNDAENDIGKPFFRDFLNWFDIAAVVPFYIAKSLEASGVGGEDDTVAQVQNFLSLFRVLRIFKTLRHFSGTKVILETLQNSWVPLLQSLLFFIFIISVMAAGLLYFEPCFAHPDVADGELCEFADAFGALYFMIITVTTVGYGDQIPNTFYGKIIAVVAALIGAAYMAMPLAIIGNKFEEAYLAEEANKARRDPVKMRELLLENKQVTKLNRFKRLARVGHRIAEILLEAGAKVRKSSIDTIAENEEQIEPSNETFVFDDDILSRWRSLHQQYANDLREIFAYELEKRRASKRKKFRSRLTSDANAEHRLSMDTADKFHKLKREHSVMTSTALSKWFASNEARDQDIIKATKSKSWRSKLWLIVSVPESSRCARIWQLTIIFLTAASILLCLVQTDPAYNLHGPETRLCKRVIWSYCNNLNTEGKSLSRNPGCSVCTGRLKDCKFGQIIDGIDFSCNNASMFATDIFPDNQQALPGPVRVSPCLATQCVCSLTEQANLPDQTELRTCLKNNPDNVGFCSPKPADKTDCGQDLGLEWAYVEITIAAIFSLEFLTRVAVARSLRRFFFNIYNIVDLLSLGVCVVELIMVMTYFHMEYNEIRYGVWGIPYVSGQQNTFRPFRAFVFVRFVSIIRNFNAPKVFILTVKKSAQKMAIPVFFLFIFVIVFAAILYQFEKSVLYIKGEGMANASTTGRQTTNAWEMDGNALADGSINDMFDAIWVMFVTMTTVGYGGKYAITPGGKIVTVIAAFFGSFYLAMPLTIIGNKFYEIFTMHQEHQASRVRKRETSHMLMSSAVIKLKRKAKEARARVQQTLRRNAADSQVNELVDFLDMGITLHRLKTEEDLREYKLKHMSVMGMISTKME
eukprot:g3953.t1